MKVKCWQAASAEPVSIRDPHPIRVSGVQITGTLPLFHTPHKPTIFHPFLYVHLWLNKADVARPISQALRELKFAAPYIGLFRRLSHADEPIGTSDASSLSEISGSRSRSQLGRNWGDRAGDMVGLLNAIGVDQAVIVGHDWGAPVAWHSALFRPDRFKAVVGLSGPFRGRPAVRPTTAMPKDDKRQVYMLYFQSQALPRQN